MRYYSKVSCCSHTEDIDIAHIKKECAVSLVEITECSIIIPRCHALVLHHIEYFGLQRLRHGITFGIIKSFVMTAWATQPWCCIIWKSYTGYIRRTKTVLCLSNSTGHQNFRVSCSSLKV